jgi:hypothetical protein
MATWIWIVLLSVAAGSASGQILVPPSPPTAGTPAGFDRDACQAIDDWIKVGGTRANFPGMGVGGHPEPFMHCTPLLARISHAAQTLARDRCGQTVLEVNLDYEIEQEGELWLNQDLTRGVVLVHRFNGRQKNFRLRRADGFYFDTRHDECRHSGRRAFAGGVRLSSQASVKLFLFAPPGPDGVRILYGSPSLEEPTGILGSLASTDTSIYPPNEARISVSLSVEDLRGLRESRPLTREVAWKEEAPDEGRRLWNRLRFELSAEGGPGILAVTPGDGLTAYGPDAEGKFTPSSKSYSLKNTGRSALDFAVDKGKDWVDIAPAAGTLAPGAERRVTVSVNDRARALKKPDRDTVRFVNKTSSSGDTTRPVEVTTSERWRITVKGWDTLYFGDNVLAGGLKAHWRIVLDLIVEGDRLREGRGTAGFGRHESHSEPPGVYDCVALAGTHLDAARTRQPTPYIRQTGFPVTGTMAGRTVKLTFAPGNYYVLGYHCVMDTDRAAQAFADRKLPIRPEDRVRTSRIQVSEQDVRHLPSGLTTRLVDGWTESVGRTTSFDAHTIQVQQLK